MIINPNDRVLVLRISNYKKHDFVVEHSALIEKNRNVWMLKAGKPIPDLRLKETVSALKMCILKAPKASGGKYYLAIVTDTYNGLPDKGMVFPEYYHDMMADEHNWTLDSLSGTWFKLSSIKEINDSIIDNLVLTSNRKKVSDVLNSTRSSVVYVSPRTETDI